MLYLGYIGIKENKMETAIMGFRVLGVCFRDNGK